MTELHPFYLFPSIVDWHLFHSFSVRHRLLLRRGRGGLRRFGRESRGGPVVKGFRPGYPHHLLLQEVYPLEPRGEVDVVRESHLPVRVGVDRLEAKTNQTENDNKTGRWRERLRLLGCGAKPKHAGNDNDNKTGMYGAAQKLK